MGYVIGYLYGSPWVGLAIAVGIALLLQIGAYFSGDKIVLASARARAVTPEDEPRLHNIVEGLAIAAGVPKPAVYVVPEQSPNAFATGRDPEHSSVAVTQGLLDTMNRVELEGVLGHEMSHVVDRDILYGTIVATVIGAIVLLSEFFLRSWWWGGFGGRRAIRATATGESWSWSFAVGFALDPGASSGPLIRLADARNREYLADAQGAMLTGIRRADQRAQEDPKTPARDASAKQRRPSVVRPALARAGGRRPEGWRSSSRRTADRGGSAPRGDVDDPVEMTGDRRRCLRRAPAPAIGRAPLLRTPPHGNASLIQRRHQEVPHLGAHPTRQDRHHRRSARSRSSRSVVSRWPSPATLPR